MSVDLKLCAFCGSKAELNESEKSGRPLVSCTYFECLCHGPIKDSVELAIKAWNTRIEPKEKL